MSAGGRDRPRATEGRLRSRRLTDGACWWIRTGRSATRQPTRAAGAGSPQHPSGRPIGYPGYVGANAHSEPPAGAELGRGDVRGTMVAIADGRGCIAFCSAGAGVLLGWTSQEMVGQPASSVFTSAISEALTPDAGEWLSEMVLRTRDGRPVPATVRVAQRSENVVTIDTKPRERALISHASSKASSKRSYAGFGRRAASHGRESAVRGG
ncbi:PAS domain-containing protein [Streptomyces seoulensis]|uniref:PAS domain-containing protein n=1 Tax=Streptomyces seoulensis TaxID=73044 RepID=UPI00365023ED